MQSLFSRYAHLPGNSELVIGSLCALLAENPDSVDWSGFGLEEWELLQQMALQEGVAAMAYHLLSTEADIYRLASVDLRTIHLLKERESVTAIRNAYLFRQLIHLLDILSEKNVPVVLLKGADMARSLYPQPGLRPMDDLDLLVPQQHFDEALAWVKAAGYRENIPEASPGYDRLLSHHVPLRKEGSVTTLLELHWTLVAPPAFRHSVPVDWFWHNLEPPHDRNGKPISGLQNTVFALNPTANLLYLAAHHLLQHGGEEFSLRWLLDLQRLMTLRRGDIDWQALVRQASEFGWCGALGVALEWVQDCFATELPDGLLAALNAQAGPYDAFVDQGFESTPTRTLVVWKTLGSLSWPGRLRLLLTRAFPSPAYVRWRYPSRPRWLLPLSYVYFWIDVTRDGWRTLRHILHPPSK